METTGNPYASARKRRAAERAHAQRTATQAQRVEQARDNQAAEQDMARVRAMFAHPSYTRRYSDSPSQASTAQAA
jgi:nitrogen fixation protein FixH